jgi:hypothetical protein
MIRSWKDQKNRLCLLIKLISDHYGKDEKTFLADYCGQVVQKYSNNLDLPLKCFESLANDWRLRLDD